MMQSRDGSQRHRRIVEDVVDRLIDSQHPDWLRMIDAARLDEAAEVRDQVDEVLARSEVGG